MTLPRKPLLIGGAIIAIIGLGVLVWYLIESSGAGAVASGTVSGSVGGAPRTPSRPRSGTRTDNAKLPASGPKVPAASGNVTGMLG